MRVCPCPSRGCEPPWTRFDLHSSLRLRRSSLPSLQAQAQCFPLLDTSVYSRSLDQPSLLLGHALQDAFGVRGSNLIGPEGLCIQRGAVERDVFLYTVDHAEVLQNRGEVLPHILFLRCAQRQS